MPWPDEPDDDLERWQYHLPPDRVASHPAPRRDEARLLVLDRDGGTLRHRVVRDLPGLLRPGDLLVANDSRVIPARLRCVRASGGQVEILVLSPEEGAVPALLRPARRLKVGESLAVVGGGRIRVVALPDDEGLASVVCEPSTAAVLASGEMPIPPYLGREAEPVDAERYQTVYAAQAGSVAAPTAGLHLTHELLAELQGAGIGFATVTLHVGIGTFRPLRAEDVARGELHPEPWVVPQDTAEAIARTRAAGGRVIAVGTTSTRVLETAARDDGSVPAGGGTTRLFIRPPWRWKAVDGLLTNFHLPGSSLLMLVGSLVERDRLLEAYREAVREKYRFYSYGDAMLVLP